MIEIAVAVEAVKKINEALTVIGKLVSKLKSDPDLAAQKLADALDEIRKTWQVLDDAITDYISLGIYPEAIEMGSKTLLKIEGGRLHIDVAEGRGHCHVIRNIYHEHLNRWFERALKGEELRLIQSVFSSLTEADYDVFTFMEDVAEQLQQSAKTALDMIYNGEAEKAREQVLASRKELEPLRTGLSDTMQKLYSLRSEFIKISGAV